LFIHIQSSREKSTPLIQTQMTSNTTIVNKNGRDVGKRLYESGTYKDPRLIYDVDISFFLQKKKQTMNLLNFRARRKLRKRKNNLLKHRCRQNELILSFSIVCNFSFSTVIDIVSFYFSIRANFDRWKTLNSNKRR